MVRKPREENQVVVEEVVPAWIQGLRQAAAGLLKQSDIEEIVKGQIKRAKAGDKNAIKFVFDQLLGGSYMRGATFIQNNYAGGNGQKPGGTKALPGSSEKVEEMRRRVTAGGSAFDKRDARPTID